MLTVGDSGSGKTLFMQDVAVQASLMGHVLFINPKPADDLSAMVDLVKSWGVPGFVINMDGLDEGELDPVRYARTPDVAANIAVEHISTVITDLSEHDQAVMASGLRTGLREGARCIGEAIEYIENETIRDRILTQHHASPKWAIGISLEPVTKSALAGTNSLTLIQFDESIEPPTGEFRLADLSPVERVALSQMRLVNRASMEMLFKRQRWHSHRG